MMFRSTLSLPRALAILSLCIAFAAGGVAHRVSAQVPDLALLSYVGAGGALGDICGGDPEHESAAPACSVCVMAGLALLPERGADAGVLAARFDRVVAPRPAEPGRAARLNRRCPVRGPPAA